ncbi:hypothetical protein DMC30DRAFT_60199 [Rhodotorula diobovata]|uniref:Uncharacterized protein n=1 Tax=Rhodotorula diobovata TaxID=5288 RepID=A0A5C5FNE3_9BASI|nr:hypothetical protein DMC30DRAFT_60199 [Rhodotorula diobovata]
MLTSAGQLPYRDAQGRYSGGGGGGGLNGGVSSGAFAGSGEESTSPGCSGDSIDQSWRINPPFWGGGGGEILREFDDGTPNAYAEILAHGPIRCEPLVAVVVTVPSTTVVETTTRLVDKTTLAGATATSTVDEVTTVTPSTSSVFTTEDVFTTPSTSVVETTETSVTTPLTSTVIEKTTDTTLAAGRRTPVATRYITETLTTEPPTSVSTATQTVPTGVADCTTYRVIYPSACCPSKFLTLTQAPEQRARRRSVHLQARTLTDRSFVTSGETTTTTTVDYTATVTESDVTVLTTSTEIVEASTPLTTVTESRTLEAPTPLITSTVTELGEAPTPLVTTTQTALARGLAASLRAVLFPTLTVSTQTTTTLETPVTTTTVTEEVQSTVCAEQLVCTYARCPNTSSAGAALKVKAAERARLDDLRAQSGGRSVTVDCGAAGVFTY